MLSLPNFYCAEQRRGEINLRINEIYCSVCGLELCYTEYVINNWISVEPLAADPLIGLRSFLFPAVPEKAGIIWKLEFM